MSCDDLCDYLQQLKDGGGSDVRIDWNVIAPNLVRAVNHDQLAGLQLVDAVASSVFYAVHKNQYSEQEDRYLRLIAPIIYRREGRLDGSGTKFWCNDKPEIERVLSVIQN